MEVQTEATNLSVVEETAFNASTPPASGWRNIEPNSYGNVGPSMKSLARDPISKNLQLRKGMLTDMDSMVPFEHDLTKDLIDRFGEGIFRCKVKHSGGTSMSQFQVRGVTATGFTVDAAGDLAQRTLVYVRGAKNEANNGLHLVGASSTTTEVKTSGTVIETIASTENVTLEVAGFRFASGDLQLDNSGNLTTGSKDLTTLGLNEEQWVVVGGRDDGVGAPYSFADPNFRGSAKIARGGIATHKLTFERRAWLVEDNAFLDIGTVSTGNVDTVVEAIERGAGGNSITLTVVADSGTAAGTISEVGTAVTIHVKTTATATTVAQFEALVAQSTLIRVRTADPTGTDPVVAGDVFGPTALAGGDHGSDLGTGKEVEVYFTKWYRNVPIGHDDFKRPSYAFEIEYPELDDGSPEYEYALGNMINEWTWNFPLAGKATVSLGFVGCRTLNPTPTRFSGPDLALDPNTDEGVSTSIDLQRVRIAGADESGISTDLISLKVMNKNNVSPQKQLAKLGARLLNQGKHTSTVDADLIFTSSAAIKAVKSKADCCLDVLTRNDDFGCLLDVQRLTLDSTDRKFEKDKIMSLSTKGTGFQHRLSTDSLSVFAWLPELPEADQ